MIVSTGIDFFSSFFGNRLFRPRFDPTTIVNRNQSHTSTRRVYRLPRDLRRYSVVGKW